MAIGPLDKLQNAFTGGVLAPQLYARTDLSKYQIGLREAENFFVHAHGGLSNRAGWKFINKVLDRTKTYRCIPFSFSKTQTYALIFGNLTMRVIKDGGLVLEPGFAISGVTQANPGVVTHATAAYANGDWVYISGAVGMTELNGNFYQVANVTATTFELQDTDGNNIDTTGFTAYTSGGTVYRVFTLTTPYADTDLALLKFTQSADVMTIDHGNYAERELTRTDHHVWTLTSVTYAPEIATPSGGAATPATSGSETYKYAVTALAEETLEESLAHEFETTAAAVLSSTDYIDLSWTDPGSGIDRWNLYREKNGLYGFIGATETNSFKDDNIGPDLADTPPKARNPFASNNYPYVPTFHQQRKWRGGSDNNPETVWGSQTGNFNNMNVSRPTKDDDAITFTLGGEGGGGQVFQIRHFVSINDLIVLTSGAEFILRAGDSSGVITPSSRQIKPQSYVGCNQVPPIVIKETALFIQEMGSKVHDLGYQLEIDGYTGSELSILANHLFENFTILEWAYAKEPYSIVWAVRSDGALLALTYLREHQVVAWTTHVTDGTFESICSITEGTEDVLYAIVKRTINGVEEKYIERMQTRKFLPNVEDAFFVDSGLSFDGWNTTAASTMTLSGGTDWEVDETITITENGTSSPFVLADVGRIIHLRTLNTDGSIAALARLEITGYTSSTVVTAEPQEVIPVALQGVATTYYGFAVTSISGLDHLEGKTVSALIDGSVDNQKTVTNGAITLDDDGGVKGHIGLPYNSTMQTLPIDLTIGQQSTAHKKKRISKVNIRYLNSRGGKTGSSLTNLRQVKPLIENYSQPISLVSKIISDTIKGKNTKDGSFFFRQEDPLPTTILGVTPEVEIAE